MPRAVVVDDESGVWRARQGLVAEKFELVTLGDGPNALKVALTEIFDVIVLDAIIPGPSDYRDLEQLRGAGIDLPVVLLPVKDGELAQADGV